MYNYISEILRNAGFEDFSSLIAYGVLLVMGVLACFLLRAVIRFFAGRVLKRATQREAALYILVKRASNIVIPVVFIVLARDLTGRYPFLGVLVDVASALVVLFIVFSCIKSVGAIYDNYEVSKTFPIHGILQVVMAATGIIGGIVIVAILIGQSPMVMLGSLGAMTAILTLIFKDAILGFMAGILLTTNKMIIIGDWIEVPNHNANGIVTDLTMTTVTVENFDKTITSIPAYSLISDSFINWRGMIATGARRIKRPFHIDSAMVRTCTGDMLERYKKMPLLKGHFTSMDEAGFDGQFTNLGVFRAYITAYLRSHPQIQQDMTLVVRQLDPGATGIPMEVIAFAKATAMMDFEPIQADIFDHIYAVISEFDLRLYQNPSGNDLREIRV
ncbi:MAG: mechanosensitive ion channel [Defluviitaleaceae bacterium]|nr:mechanosensitive ion channel [Defluviitaleaceae bacterium]MCL2239108.1 mechanosensitive ion channel [Defluviitaleaceae bacterium]